MAVLLGLLVIGEAGSRLIWSVSDLSLSPENAHLIDHPTRLWVQAPNARFQLPEQHVMPFLQGKYSLIWQAGTP